MHHEELAYSIAFFFFFFKQKTAYEIRPCDWSSDVCSSDLARGEGLLRRAHGHRRPGRFQYEAAIQSTHCARAVRGTVDLNALRKLHRALLRVAPSLGAAVASAAV